MATITKFEDLDVWQLARQLNIKLVPLLEKLNELKSYDLKSQLDRSAGSVMDNISEGFERDGNREFIQFFAIAKGSLGEVRSQHTDCWIDVLSKKKITIFCRKSVCF